MTELRALDEVANDLPTAPGSFADRVASRRVDLVELVQNGIPEVVYLPGSDRMLMKGKRHYMPGAKKLGKSLGSFVLLIDIALAGATVIVFDRENGKDEYARRLDQIFAARGISQQAQLELSEQIRYYEFPRFRDDDGADLVALAAGADLVIFDSQRMFLSDLNLEESGNDDYADFMAALVDPLFRAGITTLILDNTGHNDPKRGRGASAKGDLNEIIFSIEAVERFNLDTTGRMRVEITDSRFGTSGRWELEIGGGTFGSWHRVDTETAELGGFRPTGLMERASIFIEACTEPPARRTIATSIGGKGTYARLAIERLILEGYARGAKGHGVESIKPYREADDPVLHPNASVAEGDEKSW